MGGRREGKLDEADEELQKGRILEQQLEEMEKAAQVSIRSKGKGSKHEHPNVSDTLPVEGDVTDQDMQDPSYLSILRNLGWNDNDDELLNSSLKHSKQNDSDEILESSFTRAPHKIPTKASRRAKAEIQRELLGLKRKALSLRRQGNIDEADEVLETAKALDAEIAEMEAPKKVVETKFPKEKVTIPAYNGAAEEDEENVTENDMTDPALLSMLNNLGWKDEEVEPVTMQEEYSKDLAHDSLDSGHPSSNRPSSGIQVSPPRSKAEIQRELLGLKRKALVVRRNGQVEEAEELLQRAKALEAEMEELEAPKSKLVLDSSEHNNSANFESFSKHERLGNLNNEVIVKKGPIAVVVEPSETVVESSIGLGRMETDTDNSTLRNSDELFTSQNSEGLLRQAVLSHKKKALALKRDGKLAEAREELRQAKLLEKSMTEDGTAPKFRANDVPTSASTVRSDAAKEQATSGLAPKPLSGRDRFKLQQESLSHKRQALKLRRDGRTQEAEAEFELAKSLEAKLEELGAHDSTKSSSVGAETVDNVVVEDFLDPELLFALKAIGLDDSSVLARGPERPELVKPNASKNKNVNQGRIHLEEQIKEEVKAVNLKRSGKQAEALDTLQKAKMMEKKLNSL